MAYENDIIMRQVRDMTRMLAKILFGKNTATYEYKEEDRHTATDSLYARLIALVDAGKINGSGKSTLMRLITKELLPSEGQIICPDTHTYTDSFTRK